MTLGYTLGSAILLLVGTIVLLKLAVLTVSWLWDNAITIAATVVIIIVLLLFGLHI